MITTTYTGVLQHLDCSSCGMTYGLDKDFIARRQDDHKTFYCPNGHTQWWPQKSDTERLEDELSIARSQRNNARADAVYQKRQAAAAKGQKTRIMNLIKAGVCPVCRERNFTNVRRHMETQHPDEE